MSFETKTLGEVCSVGDGAHAKVQRVESGIPYLTSKNIGEGVLKLDKLDFISEESFGKLFPVASRATRRPQAGDVLFGIIGSFGNTYLYKKSDHFGFSSSIGILRPDPELLDSKYLFYVMRSRQFRDIHANHNSGSVQGYTNIPTVKGLPIPLPNLAIQRKIANILSSFDSKIQSNLQTNQTLEEMAQAIFKSWFVDFDPVKAKINGQQPVGMDEATAALFPDKFVESELGLIPEGWAVRKLSDICKNHSQSYNLKNVTKVIFVNTGDVLEGDFLHNDYSSVEELPGQAKKAIKEGDILYSEIRPKNKRYAYVDSNVSDYVVSTKFMVIQTNEKIHPRLLYMILTRQNTIDEFNVIADSRSGTFPQITFKAISNLEFCIAPNDVQEVFVAQVMPLIKLQKSLKEEKKQLDELRDTLLPKLLSGELSLDQAQDLTEVSP
ncbi:restriction endonuclease subunit S [Marinomonas spartinae]|uniref:restriction endonuclease subunit S n=1 Tax=Marinomonas spartinae TaxID=1792290 RepID=UPI0018F218B4|nr:restriction endonuclease subunit S [Marinomonas spartinae]MBJ7555099.1 restriction endonuclease subunit S [Marinomonas spartinae]